MLWTAFSMMVTILTLSNGLISWIGVNDMHWFECDRPVQPP